MATTSATALPVNDKDMETHIADLATVDTEEDLEKKLKSMSKFGFSLASWMKILFNRDLSKEEFKAEWLTIDEYKNQAYESMQNAWRIINLPTWKVQKRGAKGDIVETVATEQFGKVYRFTGLVECPAKYLFDEFKNNLTKLPEWNPTILKSELIKTISEDVDLSYQVTAGGGGGIIAPRDFVILRKTAPLNKDGAVLSPQELPYAYISSGVSVNVPGYPPCQDHVRGHNKIGCWLLKPKAVTTAGGKVEQHTIFQWLMCCDLKGKIPQFVLDTAFGTVMLDYIVHVRKFVADAKAKGQF